MREVMKDKPKNGIQNRLSVIRSKFANELANPSVRDMLMRLTKGEVGNQGALAQQAFMETVFNRAAARGQTLTQAMTDRRILSIGNSWWWWT